jgi:membrane protein DedA with SNARE-associated domain
MWTVFFGRFVAGIRGAVFLSAGVSGFSYARFLLMDTLAALLTVPIWIWLGMKWGENWEAFLDVFKKGQIWVLAAIAAAAVGGFIYWRIKRRRAAQPPA